MINSEATDNFDYSLLDILVPLTDTRCPFCTHEFLLEEDPIACPACGYATDNWLGEEEIEEAAAFSKQQRFEGYREKLKLLLMDFTILQEAWAKDPSIPVEAYHVIQETRNWVELCNNSLPAKGEPESQA